MSRCQWGRFSLTLCSFCLLSKRTVPFDTLAILILQVLSSGFNMFPQISNFYRNIIWGAVLILVMIYNHVSEDLRVKKMARQAAAK